MKRATIHPICRSHVERAIGPTPWDLTNKILYGLCQDHPARTDRDAVLAKMLIIGRVYSASIERRKNKKAEETTDSFYFSNVAPAIVGSKLDDWIDEAKAADPDSDKALTVMVEVHKLTTDLFSQISGLEKRSLASKYLHFHVPELFYVLDSRAERPIRGFRGFIGKASPPTTAGDNTYSNFVAKCALLRSRCETEFGIKLSPRKLDNLLLSMTS